MSEKSRPPLRIEFFYRNNGIFDVAGEDFRLDPLYEKLTGIFHDVFEDDSIVLTPELAADDLEEWDSLNHVRLILTVQKAFDIKFSAAQTASLRNVGDLVDLIRSKTAAA